MSGYPPFAPYEPETDPPPPSVVEMIAEGHGVRVRHKSKERRPVHSPPKPAMPRGPKATDVELSPEALRKHARCLRKHNAVLTDRMARMARPDRRHVISKWREYANTLPPQAINRFRNYLEIDEPFKPDQAYQFFVNLKKGKKCDKANKCKRAQKGLRALCGDRRYVWARKATVNFARGIQQRLARPGAFDLEDDVLRLSDIILNEMCGYMRICKPSRRTRNAKCKFVIEMADKVAVWIEEILAESEDRMLMMDFDEDDDVLGRYDGYADDFLDMMGGRGRGGPAYTAFKGQKLKAFNDLTDAMNKKGDKPLVQHGKFKQSYEDAANELRKAKNFAASDYNTNVANQLKKDLHDTVKPFTTPDLQTAMNQVIDIASDYLAQVAEHNKDKGPAFKHLVDKMKQKPNENLLRKGKVTKTYGEAAKQLEQAQGLETDHDDPNLSQEVHSKLSRLVENNTPPELKSDMADTINTVSKYLSQAAADEADRGPAFDHMIKELEKKPREPFTPEHEAVATKHDAAHVLKSAPGLSSTHPNPNTAGKFKGALQKAVGGSTPKNMQPDMKDVIDRSGDYLSEFVEDRGKVLDTLLKKMKAQPSKELSKRNGYSMSYGDGAAELEATSAIVPIMPIKDIADEIKQKLTKDTEDTPQNLKKAMNSLIKDAAGHLSQIVALKSGVAGPNYNTNFLKAVNEAKGNKVLEKYKDYNLVTYPDADEDGAETEQERARRLAVENILGRPETPEEKARRMAIEKRLGRPETAEEMKNRMVAEKILGRPETDEEREERLAAEKRLGRPETEVEMRQRRAEADLKKYDPETEEQRQARYLAEQILGRPETKDERKRRLEAEKRLGRPETPEEMKKRLAEERAAGIDIGPETEEEKSRRLAAERILGRPETSEERARRIEAEKRLGRPETEAEMKSRMAAEKLLGRAETAEERQNRMEAEKRLGRPETEEEIKQRIAAEELKKYGPESEQQRQGRKTAEQILGRPETPEERQRRLEAERRLGRPETPEEMKKRLAEERAAGIGSGPETEEEKSRRLAAERILGRPETPEEKARRFEAEKRLGRPETEAEMKSRMAAEKLLDRAETAEERQNRIEAEKRLGRPETEEEMKQRIAVEELKKYGHESEQQRQGRKTAEQILGRPETPEERQRRLEAERRLGRPETPEEMKKRLAEERAAGIGSGPETEEEKSRRLAAERIPGRPETPEEKARRIEAEKRLGRPETEAEMKSRMAVEKLLGRAETAEERQNRMEAEKRLGRPETEMEMKQRIAAEEFKKYGPETEQQRQGRKTAEQILGRPETPEERLRRLEAERRLGRPETTEEMKKRLAEERAAGIGGAVGAGAAGIGPETEEEKSRRLAAERILGRPETPEERARRIEAEKRLGRPETEAEMKSRMAAEKLLGRAETAEERQNRMEAEKRLGRPETEGEMKQRVAAEELKKYGPETEQERQARKTAEQILGRPETPEERQRRLEAERRLGRPETPEEMKKRLAEERAAGIGGGGWRSLETPESEEEKRRRLAAEKILGRPETEAERQRRLSVERRLGRPETEEEMRRRIAEDELKKYGPETESQRAARKAAENVLGRPETAEERARRLEIEKRLGRPETPEELRRRLAEEGKIPRAEAHGGPREFGTETEAERKRRLEVEKMLGRPETEDEHLRRLAAERRLGRPETAEERRQRLEAEEAQRREDERLGITPEMRRKMDQQAWAKAHDPERESALQILHKQLRAKGKEPLYQQPQSDMGVTHEDASNWLKKGPVYVDKSVKDSGDTARLAQKLERKLGNLVSNATPAHMKDIMQDVVIESARTLAEYFVAKTYKNTVEDALISQMQKKGNDIVAGVDGAAETCFFAAQRLKLPKPAQQEPRSDVAYKIGKRLDSIAKQCPISRNMISVMKDHVKSVSNFLSGQVTKPNPQIEAYVRLLEEMDAAGDQVLVDGPTIKKTYKEAADYLRGLTSFEDKIKLADPELLSSIDIKLSSLTKDVVSEGFPPAVMNHVVSENAKLLASYITLLEKKTAALQVLTDCMEDQGDSVLLRHGIVRKTFKDGADTLRGKTADQLQVKDVEPVACRKIEIKLENFMEGKTPREHAPYMDEVIDDVTNYLAVALLHPQRVKVCKCMKNVFVQCELWCEEILRRLARPCCVCSRVVATEPLMDLLEPGVRVRVMPGAPAAFAPGVDIVMEPCPAMALRASVPTSTPRCTPCPGLSPSHRSTASYMVYETTRDEAPTRLPRSVLTQPSCSMMLTFDGPDSMGSTRSTVMNSSSFHTPDSGPTASNASNAYVSSHQTAHAAIYTANVAMGSTGTGYRNNSHKYEERTMTSENDSSIQITSEEIDGDRMMVATITTKREINSSAPSAANRFLSMRGEKATMSSEYETASASLTRIIIDRDKGWRSTARQGFRTKSNIAHKKRGKRNDRPKFGFTSDTSNPTGSMSRGSRMTGIAAASQTIRNTSEDQPDSTVTSLTTIECECPNAPITTEDMSDWHALLVSLMWNVQAWRGWLQENINRGLNYHYTHGVSKVSDDKAELKDNWTKFQRKVTSEALQWRQYNIFSRQLMLRLSLRYRDKQILSPGRLTNKTRIYNECQREMLDIIRMFNSWTQWLMSVVKEADAAKLPAFSNCSIQHIRWYHFKRKVEANLADWEKYSMHLKVAWEQKYCMIVSEWLPSCRVPGPVWVVSACGAVPSGAVVAGLHHAEIIYVARTTHKSEVYPAAVLPSKHCCIVYAEGTTFYYTKYQVMCNASVKWMPPSRAELVSARAVRVSGGVHVGRVRYRGAHLVGAVRGPAHRCHVVILGKAFAFNSYDLLVLADEERDEC